MVDVLINCLLRNKEIVDELASNNPGGSNRSIDMPDGDDYLRNMYDHSSAATSATLNVGSASSEEQVQRLCELYKLDKLSNVNNILPDLWTKRVPVQSPPVSSSLPYSILPPEAAEYIRNRMSAQNEVTSQEMDIYLNNRSSSVKRETSTEGADEMELTELIIPGTGDSFLIPKHCLLNSPETKSGSPVKSAEEESNEQSLSPLPALVQVKQEPSPGVSSSPSPPLSRVRELPPASTVIAQAYSSPALAQSYDSLTAQYSATSPLQFHQNQPGGEIYMVSSQDYRGLPDYYTEQIRHNLAAAATNVSGYTDTTDTATFVDRYIRQASGYKSRVHGLAVDLPSPDSGIGETAITIDSKNLPHIFDYSELSQPQSILPTDLPAPSRPASSQSGSSRRSWHDYGRNAELDKVQIPKVHSDVGFRYFFESPISTSQRREDDRITYINKGQFYGVTLEYTPDPNKPLKSSTVKTVLMLMFRDEKPMEEELKAWQFWHSRQHSVKQRILDADTKNSTGIIGQIDEITHNAIAFYWNPMESPAKVNIAVQCLSTDFSNQKGVKGLPLHVQIDTFDDFRESATPYHRGYCQIKVFCDKGAERKTRDEERRAAKRKLNTAAAAATDPTVTFPVRKKLEELYHLPCERSEFYSMSDLLKPPVLFTPSEDAEKMHSIEMSFYASSSSLGEDPNGSGLDRRDNSNSGVYSPPAKRRKRYPEDRVLLYTRQESEVLFQALHIHPPTVTGLVKGIEKKYNISCANMRNIYKKNKKGVLIQIDDDVVKHYCNEDMCVIEVTKADEDLCDITLIET
ncbi:hypothetical protein JTE90_002627 [Oedothorax gibbosus]|uniref:Grh/CP2 DB domain-containing protein n=1 Tax=Oedothorax gibbosus TaxID=931172 RepID=A0AAV6VHH6_9ARAC|nr:hypothetical protein JTE90_002627 [Oedothorax gibbosus]